MNSSQIPLPARPVRRFVAATLCGGLVFAFCLADSLGDPGPAQAGPRQNAHE
ncbi:MAG: hypothetical protein M3480_11095 [Verrucomicrobiota bacterium]|nr:hypothetical protein [Chthoniobacterales bacterium]MDQ3415494.1 hypothetical protein [Verrucomicrobiota bacterium]